MPSNPLFNANRLKLGVFGFNGQAPSMTTLEEVYVPTWPGIEAIGKIADHAGFETLVPFARWKYGHVAERAHRASVDVYDPFVWAAGLGAITTQAAVMSTTHMSLMHPIIAAKQAATIDHISGGRFAMNVVAGWNAPEFKMFGGSDLAEHSDRYAQAAEWMDVIRLLWSNEDEINYRGETYNIEGGESFPKPIQRPFPPIMNAGGSDKGRAFAAKYADMCFTIVKSSEAASARADVDAYRSLARGEFNRNIQVWTVAYVIQRDTQDEADAYQRYILENADTPAVKRMLAMLSAQSKMMSKEAFDGISHRYISGGGGFPLVGTAERIVDQLAALSGAGIDGVLLCWLDYEDGLARWNRTVMPMLEQAGLREARRQTITASTGTAYHG